jgi:hypothetical protein
MTDLSLHVADQFRSEETMGEPSKLGIVASHEPMLADRDAVFHDRDAQQANLPRPPLLHSRATVNQPC